MGRSPRAPQWQILLSGIDPFSKYLREKIGIRLGSEASVLGAGKNKVIKAPPANGESWYQVELFQESDNTARPLVSTRWPFREDFRAVVIFYPDDSGRLRYHAVDCEVEETNPPPQ